MRGHFSLNLVDAVTLVFGYNLISGEYYVDTKELTSRLVRMIQKSFTKFVKTNTHQK